MYYAERVSLFTAHCYLQTSTTIGHPMQVRDINTHCRKCFGMYVCVVLCQPHERTCLSVCQMHPGSLKRITTLRQNHGWNQDTDGSSEWCIHFTARMLQWKQAYAMYCLSHRFHPFVYIRQTYAFLYRKLGVKNEVLQLLRFNEEQY